MYRIREVVTDGVSQFYPERRFLFFFWLAIHIYSIDCIPPYYSDKTAFANFRDAKKAIDDYKKEKEKEKKKVEPEVKNHYIEENI